MLKRAGSWGIPTVAFVIAIVLAMLTGPMTPVQALRAPREETPPPKKCKFAKEFFTAFSIPGPKNPQANENAVTSPRGMTQGVKGHGPVKAKASKEDQSYSLETVKHFGLTPDGVPNAPASQEVTVTNTWAITITDLKDKGCTIRFDQKIDCTITALTTELLPRDSIIFQVDIEPTLSIVTSAGSDLAVDPRIILIKAPVQVQAPRNFFIRGPITVQIPLSVTLTFPK